MSIKLFISYCIITENNARDLTGPLQQMTDSNSGLSPENSNANTFSQSPAGYENTNVHHMEAGNYENAIVDQMVAANYENTNVDQMVATNYENTNVNQMVAANYENTNVDQMVAANYGNQPPQNSGTYESVRFPDSSHIYDAQYFMLRAS